MKTSETIAELAKALCEVQKELKPAPKDCKNPFFSSMYASLNSCVESSRPLLTKNNLSVSQGSEDSYDGKITLTTRLLHNSGEWMESTITVIPSKMDPQGIGSALTYARRYEYSAIIGQVADDDDDANAASTQKSEAVNAFHGLTDYQKGRIQKEGLGIMARMFPGKTLGDLSSEEGIVIVKELDKKS